MLTADVVKVQSVQLVWYDLPDAGSSRSSVQSAQFGLVWLTVGLVWLT